MRLPASTTRRSGSGVGRFVGHFGLRLDPEEEFNGADLSIHKIGSTPERESGW
jgi:Amt family ammonium transporter